MIRNRHSTIEKFYDKTNNPIVRFPTTFHEISILDGKQMLLTPNDVSQFDAFTSKERKKKREIIQLTYYSIAYRLGNEITRLLQALEQAGMSTAGETPTARLNRFLKFIGLNAFMV